MKTNVIIVGAGPYGLSLAAMLRSRGVEHRIFGTPMHSWTTTMPKGMHLKSEGFASNLYAGAAPYTLQDHCERNGIAYRPAGLPVPLDVFTGYGQAFQLSRVPHLEPRQVTAVRAAQGGYEMVLDDGTTAHARAVVIAAGITHFAYTPPELAGLPGELGGHVSRFPDPASFAGRSLAIVGAGASATDYAALAAAAGARVTLIVRQPRIRFLGPPDGRRRTMLAAMRAPQSGLGPGWRSRMATDAPLLFHRLPEAMRIMVARRHLGPSACWWARAPIEQKVDVRTATSVAAAVPKGSQVALDLVGADGQRSRILVDGMLAATGYRPALSRLAFLSPGLRELPTTAGAPSLSRQFESAAPGLHFIGLSSVNDFGPLVRFAFGANFSASRLSAHLGARSGSGYAAGRENSHARLAALGDPA